MRLIDKDKLLEELAERIASGTLQSFEELGDVIEDMEEENECPLSSQRADRGKGEWQITDAYPHNVYCSVCHGRFAQTRWAVWEDGSLPRNFCPNCGADMRWKKI